MNCGREEEGHGDHKEDEESRDYHLGRHGELT